MIFASFLRTGRWRRSFDTSGSGLQGSGEEVQWSLNMKSPHDIPMLVQGVGGVEEQPQPISSTAVEGGRWPAPRGWHGKTRPNRDSIAIMSKPWRVTIATELSRPPRVICTSFFLTLTYFYLAVGVEGCFSTWSHSHTHIHTYTHFSGREIGPSPRPVPVQYTKRTRNRHPRPQRHSNPQSQQASGRTATSLTMRLPRLADLFL